MKEEQNSEILKLKAAVFDIIEKIELHQLEIQKLDEIRKNVINKLKELREAAAKTSTDDSTPAPQEDIEINDVSEENEEKEGDKQEESSTE